MLFYIEATVEIKVRGISGPFIQPNAFLVNAPNGTEARIKFENRIKQNNAHMQFDAISFKYIKIAEEI